MDEWFPTARINPRLSIPETNKYHKNGYISWRERYKAGAVQHGFNPTRGIPLEGDLWLVGFLLQYLQKQTISPNPESPAPLPANEIREANFLSCCPSCHQNQGATEVPLEKNSSSKHTGRVWDLTNLHGAIGTKDEGCLATERSARAQQNRVVGCKVPKGIC